MAMDWKEALAAFASEAELPTPTSDGDMAMTRAEGASLQPSDGEKQKGALHVVVEKKGRGGKTATIVEGFEIPDSEIEEIARKLKKKLGVGGSSRGGEILIQGERREAVVSLLREMGYRAK